MAGVSGRYDARAAGVRSRRARFKYRGRSKLASDTVLFGVVRHFLAQRWPPSQIAGTFKRMWPDQPQRTVSHESIHTRIYAMPRGELRKDLTARPRPLHLHWGDMGLTLPRDPPFWRTHYPPNGWGCRCYVEAVRESAEGDATEPPEGWDTEGETSGAPPGIDKGWDYAPGAMPARRWPTWLGAS